MSSDSDPMDDEEKSVGNATSDVCDEDDDLKPSSMDEETDGDGESEDVDDVEEDDEEEEGSSSDDNDSEEEDDEENENGDASVSGDSEAADDGLSEYERLRLERIARNQARLRQLGFDEPKEKEKKKKPPPKPRQSLSDFGPRRELPGRAKRATFNASEVVASAKKERKIAEKKNMDACYTCQKEDRELYSCDYCRRLYHVDCHTPPFSLNDEEFKCSACEAAGRDRRIACGRCDGCTREDDCMTCISCVAKYERGYKKSSKCLFRKCQSWGKSKLVRFGDDTADNEDDEEEEDNHDINCHVCAEGGDLICCDGCTKVYHSACHKPMIAALPEGDWYCMICCETKKLSNNNQKKSIYSGPLVANLGHCEVVCKVRFPKIECIVCEEMEVTTGRGKPQEWTTCRACDDSYHLQCLDPPLEFRPNTWKCPSCKESKIKVKKDKNKKEKESKPLFKGEHDDDCFMCFNGGELMCCDYCSKAYHMTCHIPPLFDIPTGLWKCQECAAVEYKRMMRCGDCVACLRDNCGKCRACLDKPKFGGQNKLKQSCERKRCGFMRFAPPTKHAPPKSIMKKKKKQEKIMLSAGMKRKQDGADDIDGSAKRQKMGDVSDEAQLKSPPEAVEETEAIAKAKEQVEAIDKIINNRPLKNDPVGNKIRQIITKALKQRGDCKVQDKACEVLRVFCTSADNVAKIVLLGGLKMVSTAMAIHPDKTIVNAEASALLTELVWVNPPCSVAIVDEGCLDLVLSSMERHGIHLKLQQMACGFFRALSYDFANHQVIDNVNGVSAIIDAMKRNSNKYDILKEGCYFLQNILCNPDISLQTIQLFESKDIIPTIIDAMRGAPSEISSEYLGAASGVLANLAINGDARIYIGGNDSTISTLLTILGPELSVDTAQCSLNCLKLLMTANEENKAKVVKLGGITTIMDFLILTKNSSLADASLRILAELTKNNTENSQLLGDFGGFDLVKTALASHSSPYIQASCCAVMRNLPIGDVNQTYDTALMILTAMKKHKEDKLVQFEGRQVLLKFCCNFPSIAELVQSKSIAATATTVRMKRRRRASKRDNIEEQAKDEEVPDDTNGSGTLPTQEDSQDIKKASMIEKTDDDLAIEVESIIKGKPLRDDPIGNKIRLIIIKALKNSDDSKVQDKACEVLRFMAKSPANATRIIDLGGLTMLTQAIYTHPKKPILHAEASALLSELAWVNPPCIDRIVEEGCLRLVLKSMERHCAHFKVNQMGIGFFRALSYDFANHQVIDNVDGVSAIIDSMKRNSTKYDILKEGCYFLQNILCNPDISLQTIDLVVTKDISLTIIDSIGSSSDHQYLGAACGVLANLVIDETARKQIAGYETSVATLLSVLGSSKENVDACKCSMNALRLLATSSDDMKTQIFQLDGINIVMNLLKPPNHEALVDSGLGLFLELAKENAKLLFDAGGYEFITTEMTIHANLPQVQAKACQVLYNLPIVDADQVGGVVKLILTAMKNHIEDSTVQYEGSQVLLKYCCRFPHTTELLQGASSLLGQSQYMAINYGAT